MSVPLSPEEVARELFGAFAACDPDRAAALFTPDAKHRMVPLTPDVPLLGTIEGREALRAHLRGVWRRWRQLRLEVHDIVADRSRVAARARVDAVERDGQRRISTVAVYFLTIVDGAIVEFDIYFEDVPQTAGSGVNA